MSSTSIAAALEAEPLGSKLTRFRTQTRTLASDAAARKKFDRRAPRGRASIPARALVRLSDRGASRHRPPA